MCELDSQIRVDQLTEAINSGVNQQNKASVPEHEYKAANLEISTREGEPGPHTREVD